MMKIIHAAGLLILTGAVLVFCVQNLASTKVNYLGWSITLPLPVLVFIVYLIGMFSGWMVLSYLRRSLQKLTEKPKE